MLAFDDGVHLLGTEIHLVQRLANEHPEVTVVSLDPLVCPCSTMFRIDAPHLRGITMQLLERELPKRGVQSRRATVRLRDLASFEGVFLSNALGVAIVSEVDDVLVPLHEERFETIAAAYAEVAWDTI
jgi:hypothetical protein